MNKHALHHERLPEPSTGHRFTCACGHDFGPLSVHKARKAYREHREGQREEGQASTEGESSD